MSDKCVICNKPVEKTFLGKIQGTYIKGKAVCGVCQRKLGNKLE